MKKRKIFKVLTVLLALLILCGCSANDEKCKDEPKEEVKEQNNNEKSDEIKIVDGHRIKEKIIDEGENVYDIIYILYIDDKEVKGINDQILNIEKVENDYLWIESTTHDYLYNFKTYELKELCEYSYYSGYTVFRYINWPDKTDPTSYSLDDVEYHLAYKKCENQTLSEVILNLKNLSLINSIELEKNVICNQLD